MNEMGTEREARLDAIFNQVAIGIAHVALSGPFIRVNSQFAALLGYAPEELLKLTFQDVTHPGDLPAELAQADRLVRAKIGSYTIEKRYLRKDGSDFWAELTVSLVCPTDRPAYFVAVMQDIDRRKKAEDELLTARYELQRRVQERTTELILEMHEREMAQNERDRFFELAHDLMIISDTRGFMRRVNPTVCQLLGYSAEELARRLFLDFVHPEDRERTRNYRMSLLSGETTESDLFENRVVNRRGEVKWIAWTGRAVPELQLNYFTGRDVTEQKARDAIEREQRALMNTNSKLHALGLMAANTAHEINNPLTIIYGEGCLMRKMLDGDHVELHKLNRMADNIVRMSERIVRIVNGLRTFARDGASDPMEVVPLRRILDDTLPFCRSRTGPGRIDLVEDLPEEEIFVCARPVQLSQALLNLLNNAYDALSDQVTGARITVFARLTDARVEIGVRDNGPGLSAAVADRLFQPFVSSKMAGQGMGLGLSIARSMIVDNGGNLYLDSEARETTFVISLPRVSSTELI